MGLALGGIAAAPVIRSYAWVGEDSITSASPVTRTVTTGGFSVGKKLSINVMARYTHGVDASQLKVSIYRGAVEQVLTTMSLSSTNIRLDINCLVDEAGVSISSPAGSGYGANAQSFATITSIKVYCETVGTSTAKILGVSILQIDN